MNTPQCCRDECFAPGVLMDDGKVYCVPCFRQFTPFGVRLTMFARRLRRLSA